MVDAPRRACASCDGCGSWPRSEWCGLKPSELQVLDRAKVPHTYRAGEILFYEGNPCLGLFCVQRGTVALRRSQRAGKAAIVRLVEAGQTLGYRAFFSGGRYGSSAHALTECRICFVDRSTVEQLLAQNPSLPRHFLSSLARDSERAEAALIRANSLSVRARLVHLLLALKAAHGQVDDEGNLVIDLPLSREDLASLIGTRPESISRAIRTLELAGAARFIGRRVLVADLDLLLDECEPVPGTDPVVPRL